MKKVHFFWICFLSLVACGQAETFSETNTPFILLSEGEILTTSEITVASDQSIIIINHDTTPHTITSETAIGAFDNSGDFDVLVPASGTALLTLPEDAVSGDEFFFYCRFHEDVMTPSDGRIIIE